LAPVAVALAAPAGRAARRMTESTGLDVLTMHELPGYARRTLASCAFFMGGRNALAGTRTPPVGTSAGFLVHKRAYFCRSGPMCVIDGWWRRDYALALIASSPKVKGTRGHVADFPKRRPSAEFWAIIGVGVTLGALLLTLFLDVRSEMSAFRTAMVSDHQVIRSELSELQRSLGVIEGRLVGDVEPSPAQQ